MARLVGICLLLSGLLFVPLFSEARQDADKAEPPPAPAGTWKFFLPMATEDGASPRWLLRFESKGSEWVGSVLDTAKNWPKGTLEKVSVRDGVLRFDIKTSSLQLNCTVRLGKDPTTNKLMGTAILRRKPTPIELERSTLTSLNPFEQLREALAQQQPGLQSIGLAMGLLSQASEQKATATEVRSWADKAIRSAVLYGPLYQQEILVSVSERLADQKGYEALALEYARRAERMLEPTDSLAFQKRVLDAVIVAAEKAGKADEAKRAQAALAKLDFSVKPRDFPGRKGKSERAVLLELFTSSHAKPCIASDLATVGLGRSFKASELVILHYHLHVPAGDPLSAPDSEARAEYYRGEVTELPTLFLDGRRSVRGGGDREDAPDRFEDYYEAIQGRLEEPAKAKLTLSATQKGETLTIQAGVSDLAATGDDIRLRVVLAEKSVTYKGGNNLGVYRHLVRHFPGGPEGLPLKEKTFKKTFTVDLAKLRKEIKEYLDSVGERRPFPNKERPLELKNLLVVAFVQNDQGGDVFQAVQADVVAE